MSRIDILKCIFGVQNGKLTDLKIKFLNFFLPTHQMTDQMTEEDLNFFKTSKLIKFCTILGGNPLPMTDAGLRYLRENVH